MPMAITRTLRMRALLTDSTARVILPTASSSAQARGITARHARSMAAQCMATRSTDDRSTGVLTIAISMIADLTITAASTGEVPTAVSTADAGN